MIGLRLFDLSVLYRIHNRLTTFVGNTQAMELLGRVCFRRRECRRHDRHTCCLNFEFIHRDKCQRGLIRNWHAEGAFVETPDSPEVGQEVTLKLPSRHLAPPTEVTGIVVWRNPNGHGVKFKSLH
jgi:hypothetical protein